MIYKSYKVEENLEILKNNIILFYGDNKGLIDEFKENIKKNNKSAKINNFEQDKILKNPNEFYEEINNISLFEDRKVFLITDITDKILETVQYLLSKKKQHKIFLFADKLNKKSILRSLFEKENKLDVIPCYPDDNVTIKKLVLKKLNNFKGINVNVQNLIADHCNKDRIKLNNEISKILNFFLDKEIRIEQLKELLNLKEGEDFNVLSNYAINGDKNFTNEFLNSTFLDEEKSIFYTTIINQRLNKLKMVTEDMDLSLEKKIEKLKPPIFWKDKPDFINQAKKWNIEKINKALERSFQTEVKIKSNTIINKSLLIKKLLIDICNLANAA